jgi:hypothetical protein
VNAGRTYIDLCSGTWSLARSEDVAGILKDEHPYSVALVGHSFAGMVITGAAEGESGRLKRLIMSTLLSPMAENRRSIFFPKQFRTHFESRLMQRGTVGDCPRAKVYWTYGDCKRAAHASMCAGDCVTLVCDASSRKFGCRRMRPQRSRRPSSRLSLRTLRRGSCSNDSGKGPAVSAGIIMNWPPDMIATWKPRNDLFLSCLPTIRLYPRNNKSNVKSGI